MNGRLVIRLFLFLVISGSAAFVAYESEPFSRSGERITVVDFPYHLAIVRSFWTGAIDNPYALEAQKSVLGHELGVEVRNAMPVGVSPSALALLAPFAAFTSSGDAASYRIASASWIFCSMLLACFGVTAYLESCGTRERNALPFLLLTLMSWTTLVGAALGQTSFAALGALGLLTSLRAPECARFSIRNALLALLLAVKLPYLLIGAAFAFGSRGLRGLLETVALPLAISALVLPRLGGQGVASFLASLEMYARADIPSEYRDYIAFPTMTSFPAAMHGVIDLTLAVLISKFAAALCLVAGALLIRRAKPNVFLGVVVASAYLLFSPYLGAYEDVLLLLPVLAALSEERLQWAAKAAIFLLLAFLVYRGAAGSPFVLAAFGAKLVIVGLSVGALLRAIPRPIGAEPPNAV